MLNGLETAANVDGVPGPREHAYIRRSKIKPINLALPSTPFMRSCSSLHNGFYYVTDRNIDPARLRPNTRRKCRLFPVFSIDFTIDLSRLHYVFHWYIMEILKYYVNVMSDRISWQWKYIEIVDLIINMVITS